MPITVPVVRTGNIITPQSVPSDHIGLRVAANSYVFDVPDDLFLADLPAHLGTNILAAPLVVNRKFAGMHYHREVPTIQHAIARNLDTVGSTWLAVAPTARGVYEWAALDTFVQTAASAGRDIVFNFFGTPRWASARPDEAGHYGRGSDAEPADMRDLADFAAAVCQRYRAKGTPITAFETWNEPKYAGNGGVNQGNYFTGTPQALARMAKAVYQAVKAVDPAALVLSPAPTGLEYLWRLGDGGGTDHLNSFMGAPDGEGGLGRDWCDAVAFHSYSHDGFNNLFAIPQMVANVRKVMAMHNLVGRPIWITETSAITPALKSFVIQRQQEFIARTLLLALGSGVERIVWYAWDDPLGFHQQPAVARYWDEFTSALAGSTLSLVNSLRNGKVAAVIDGKRHLI
jgi:Cellulase (glycosyl hydrolase family 5)